MVAPAAALGMSLLFCTSASAKLTQSITFSSTPPSPAVAGGSYVVSATSSSSLPVRFYAGRACSSVGPHGADWESVRALHGLEPPPEDRPSPQTVYFDAAGTCTIRAHVEGNPEYEAARGVSQSFAVASDPSERITFTSTLRSEAAVGASYDPSARSSAGLDVFFFSATPSVCAVRVNLGSGEVRLIAPGTCTIDASQEPGPEEGKTPLQAPEAQQSFTVSAKRFAPTGTDTTEPKVRTTPTKVEKTPTKPGSTGVVRWWAKNDLLNRVW